MAALDDLLQTAARIQQFHMMARESFAALQRSSELMPNKISLDPHRKRLGEIERLVIRSRQVIDRARKAYQRGGEMVQRDLQQASADLAMLMAKAGVAA